MKNIYIHTHIYDIYIYDIYVYISDLLCCKPESNATIYMTHTSIKKYLYWYYNF